MEKLLGWVWQDLRFAIHSLNKSRRFTLLAILALALGIGSVTVIFSAVYGVLIDTFPYAHFDRMVSFSIDGLAERGFAREMLSVPEFLDFRDQNTVFQDMNGGNSAALHYVHGNQTTQWTATRETANGYLFLGVKPLLGRLITPADTAPGAPPVFMMTYQLWKSQFNSDPSILGKTFNLDGSFYTLVGIMPPRFRAGWTDIFTAFPMNRSQIAQDPTLKNFYVWPLGYLKPGVTISQAAADLDVVAHRLAKVYPDRYPQQFRVTARSFQDRVTPMFTSVLYPLMGAVLLLFLIACTNVANLLLTRATARDREIAVRASLGATRWRLIRQLLVESFVLAALGCAAGCLFAYVGIKEIVPLITLQQFSAGICHSAELDGAAGRNGTYVHRDNRLWFVSGRSRSRRTIAAAAGRLRHQRKCRFGTRKTSWRISCGGSSTLDRALGGRGTAAAFLFWNDPCGAWL